MPGIEQIKISLPSKILRVKVDFCRGPPRHGAGAPLHLHQQGLGELREATALAYSPRPRGSVCKIHVKFFRSSYDLFLQALLLSFNRSVKRLAKLKSNEYNGLSGNRGIL
jgi:hypothetical protein